jgi:hypothetical protein
MSEKQVRFSELAAAQGNGNEIRGDSVDGIIDKEIKIKTIELTQGMDGQPMIRFTTIDGNTYRTGGKVLYKKGPAIKEQTDKGIVVTTTIVKKRGKDSGRWYYDFA